MKNEVNVVMYYLRRILNFEGCNLEVKRNKHEINPLTSKAYT